MKIINCIASILVLLTFQYSVNAQNSEDLFTIYLVRHAEKELSIGVAVNPPLSECGQRRADSLAAFHKQKEDLLGVGHSNTTGVLAGLLIGEEIGSFDEKIYNRIYQVVMYKKTGRLHLLHTAFHCDR